MSKHCSNHLSPYLSDAIKSKKKTNSLQSFTDYWNSLVPVGTARKSRCTKSFMNNANSRIADRFKDTRISRSFQGNSTIIWELIWLNWNRVHNKNTNWKSHLCVIDIWRRRINAITLRSHKESPKRSTKNNPFRIKKEH